MKYTFSPVVTARLQSEQTNILTVFFSLFIFFNREMKGFSFSRCFRCFLRCLRCLRCLRYLRCLEGIVRKSVTHCKHLDEGHCEVEVRILAEHECDHALLCGALLHCLAACTRPRRGTWSLGGVRKLAPCSSLSLSRAAVGLIQMFVILF